MAVRAVQVVAAGVALVLVGFTGYFRVQYRTWMWWGPPGAVEWCGETYARADTVPLTPAEAADLETRFVVPPFGRRVMSPAARPPCRSILYLPMDDDGTYVSYIQLGAA